MAALILDVDQSQSPPQSPAQSPSQLPSPQSPEQGGSRQAVVIGYQGRSARFKLMSASRPEDVRTAVMGRFGITKEHDGNLVLSREDGSRVTLDGSVPAGQYILSLEGEQKAAAPEEEKPELPRRLSLNLSAPKLRKRKSTILDVSGVGQKDKSLFDAAFHGENAQVQSLLEQKAHVNASNSKNWTPLFYAAGKGFKEVVDALIAHKADVKAMNEGGYIALHYAVREGHLEVIETLIEAKADVNHANHLGVTPLNEAESNGRRDLAKLLRAAGAS